MDLDDEELKATREIYGITRKTMLDEEKKAIEQARSNITRGFDIESSMLILEKCALDGVVFIGGRINIYKTAVRQILVFLKEYKNKGYLDVVREKVRANEIIEKKAKEIEELKEENQRYKRIASQKLDDIEEFRKNECEHRCIKNAEVLELKEYYKENYTPNDKVKAKIEELDIKIQCCEYADDGAPRAYVQVT